VLQSYVDPCVIQSPPVYRICTWIHCTRGGSRICQGGAQTYNGSWIERPDSGMVDAPEAESLLSIFVQNMGYKGLSDSSRQTVSSSHVQPQLLVSGRRPPVRGSAPIGANSIGWCGNRPTAKKLWGRIFFLSQVFFETVKWDNFNFNFSLKMHQKHLAAGLCLDAPGELTALQTLSLI